MACKSRSSSTVRPRGTHAAAIADELGRQAMANSIPAEKQIGTRPSFDPPAEPEWHRMIAEAAYFRAEKRNFEPGHALDDWLLAEQEVKRIISP